MNLATKPMRRVKSLLLTWDVPMASVKEDFRRALAELMARTKTTKAELARALNVSNSTVRDWLIGKILPEFGRLDDLAAYFKVDRRYFLSPAQETQQQEVAVRDLDTILRELAQTRGYRLVKRDD